MLTTSSAENDDDVIDAVAQVGSRRLGIAFDRRPSLSIVVDRRRPSSIFINVVCRRRFIVVFVYRTPIQMLRIKGQHGFVYSTWQRVPSDTETTLSQKDHE